MNITWTLLVCSFSVACNAILKSPHKLNNIIEQVNRAGASWTAGVNRFNTDDHIHLVGTVHGGASSHVQIDHNEYFRGADCEDNNDQDDQSNTEEFFDARDEWFHCPSLWHVWNQGNCAADWAISVVSAITDQICIASKGKITSLYSPQKIVSCCEDCGNGCLGGYVKEAWQYWLKRGVVTGGDYQSNEGCQPWLTPPCNSTSTGSGTVLGAYPNCANEKPTTATCDLTCYNKNYNKTYVEDIVKAKKIGNLPGCGARSFLRKHGPYVSTMRVYEDFLTYKTGVYKHVTGKYLGLLSVKIIGWGLWGGQAYWLGVNSWGTSWGEDGFFKIKRYSNECWIENFRYYGIPNV
ncbi:cathepsin B-like cysteine proteinase 4 [Adelges cooleyi]|uniref:cathepsin B-like cysteine proteinase 4 n=1 Tax=Adelges cooleyi TaxID=133065 RepID=UPI0021801526|nr:cathepsin B-like cysteine proteinase 4 [Adelges cooleyi]